MVPLICVRAPLDHPLGQLARGGFVACVPQYLRRRESSTKLACSGGKAAKSSSGQGIIRSMRAS